MIKFKHLLSLKFLILIIIIQSAIALLFVNTIGFEVEDLIIYRKYTASIPTTRLQIIVIEDAETSIESEEQFNLLVSELEANGANVFYRMRYYNDDDEIVLLIDEGLRKFQESNTLEETCTELALNYGELCSEVSIELRSSNELKALLLDNFKGYYASGWTMGVVIEYESDLSMLFNEILDKHNMKINFSIEEINQAINNRYSISKELVKLDRQNFISFGIIWLLSIILSTLLYLKSKQRNISILLLLGYNNFSILSTIIVMNLISLIIPYIILNLEGYYIISLYLIIDFIIIIISIVSMYLITLNSTKEKIKERI